MQARILPLTHLCGASFHRLGKLGLAWWGRPNDVAYIRLGEITTPPAFFPSQHDKKVALEWECNCSL